MRPEHIGANPNAKLLPARKSHAGSGERIPCVERTGPRAANAARLLGATLALLVATGALATAEGPGRSLTYAGRPGVAAALFLAAGLALAAAGLMLSLQARTAMIAIIVLLASLAWFAPAFVAWQNGSSLARSLATILVGFTFPLVAHAVLAWPGGRLGSKVARILVAALYFEAVLVAAALAIFRDPYFDSSCWANCTVNSFLVRSLPSLVHIVEVGDRWFAVAAALAVIALCVARLLGASRPALARLAPIGTPAILFASAVVARAIALQTIAAEDPYNTTLYVIFLVLSAALILLALGLIYSVLRAQAERRAVVRIGASLGDAPEPGELQQALSLALRDPELQIAYWLDAGGRYVNAEGSAVAPPAASPGRTITRLVQDKRTVALISHAGAAGELESQIGPAVRLGLENERLQSEVLARLEELRASRMRIVDTADRARIALERDLHDGAQQRLLALSYDIRLARSSADSERERAAGGALTRAIDQAAEAIEELRELARGIYPAVLTEAGLCAALHSLADTASLPVELECVDGLRYPAAVEAAAYFAVAEAIDSAARGGADHAVVSLLPQAGLLAVIVNDNGRPHVSPVAVADRVGALGGTVTAGATGCRVEIPCA
jgi:signal transduction histidine kinase